ncbi:hypothetical protein OSTOST_19170, partial [Ostertagia ostertagi]
MDSNRIRHDGKFVFYGYAVSQIPAGIIAAKFAPNKVSSYPAMPGVWRHWHQTAERSRTCTPTSGCSGILWALCWWYVSAATPNDHSYITEEERTFIVEKVGTVVMGNMT